MKISIQGTTAKQPRERIGDVRRSQVIATFGPGALLKLPYGPVIIDGTRFWERTLDSESDRLDEPNLERLLHVDHFCAPPVNEDEETEIYKGVLPASRFPAWYFCPSCGRLGRFYRIGKKKKGQLHCVHCDAVLIPSRFLIACINGHLEDFPICGGCIAERRRKTASGMSFPSVSAARAAASKTLSLHARAAQSAACPAA